MTPRLRIVGTPLELEPPWSLRTPRLTIRRLTPADREAFLWAVSATRDALAAHLPIHRPGEDDERLFRRLLHQDGGDGPGYMSLRVVGLLDDGRIAGGYNLLKPSGGLELRASMNWWTAANCTGQGLATEAVAALLTHALTEAPPSGAGLGLHLVEAWITRDNPASRRIAEKAGFSLASDQPSYIRTGDRWTLHDLYTKRG
ncbi:MAG: GNAT family N-acetyltransferase [Phycisphaerales bacterium]